MDSLLLFTIYCLLFTAIIWYRFSIGLGLLFFLLPSYLLRFQIGPIPTTFLEAMILIVFVVWFVKRFQISDFRFQNFVSVVKHQLSEKKLLSAGILLFLLAATISIFTAVDIRAAAGQWKAFFIEPFLLFIVLIDVLKRKKVEIKNLLFALILSGLATSLLAIYQHFTGWMVPWFFWENGNSFRVTAWYGFPNGLGLFLAPLYPLAIYLTAKTYKKLKSKQKKLLFTDYCLLISAILFLVTSPLAIIYAKSTGALIGVLAGIGVLLLLHKKARWSAITVGVIGLVAVLAFEPLSPIKKELILQDRSGQIRLSMWAEAVEFLKDRPLLGAGLASYDERIIPYHTTVNGEGIEIFEHPHNIFLTMWVNLGLLGLIGFVMILVWFFQSGLREKNSLSPYLLAAMATILIHGLVDSPYIKNDLAVLFWLLIALNLLYCNHAPQRK